MSLYFEELDSADTDRRAEPASPPGIVTGVDVFEIKLGDEYLMSSLFTASEIALARLGLAELSGADLEVVVGGLGLGYRSRELPDRTGRHWRSVRAGPLQDHI